MGFESDFSLGAKGPVQLPVLGYYRFSQVRENLIVESERGLAHRPAKMVVCTQAYCL